MNATNQFERVRKMCLTLPDTDEKLSHGEPTWFVHGQVFVMFANNHHDDGHIAVWLPVPPGVQKSLIETNGETYFHPPYVGGRGWVGIELARVADADLRYHVQTAWELIAPKGLVAALGKNPFALKRAARRRNDIKTPKIPPPLR